jgi:hypothetical protein
MAQSCLDDGITHVFWDNSYPARIEIEPGDRVIFECQEATGGQLTPDSDHEDICKVDIEWIHALTGPLFVKDELPAVRWKNMLLTQCATFRQSLNHLNAMGNAPIAS